MKRQALAGVVLALAGCGDQSGAIQSGMWETSLSMKAGSAELWSSTSQRCIYDEEAANPGSGLIRVGQLNHCTASEPHFNDGKFVVKATCPERQSMMADVPMSPEWLASKIEIGGRYGRTTLQGTLTAQLQDTVEPTNFNGTVTARRIGDC